MMGDKWNDKNCAPETASQPDWHLHYTMPEIITIKMVLDYLPPNSEKVNVQFELMMTVLMRIIPKWELSGQGDCGHQGDDDDDNPLKNRDGTNDFLHDCGLSSSSESSNKHEKEKERDIIEKENKTEKLSFGVLAGCLHFALSKIQDFF